MKKAEKYYLLQEELKPYIKALSDASDIIVNQDVSKYPIFVIHQQEVELGIPLITKGTTIGNWSVNASTLEEFVTKQIIKENKLGEFKLEYKNPQDYICIFSLSELGAKFIYLKRTAI